MLKVKKLKRIIYISLIVTAAVYALFFHVFTESELYGGNKYKIALIEESIRSSGNHQQCKIPNLPLGNPEIMKFYKNVDPLNCGSSDDDWVICKKSVCTVKPSILKRKGVVSCTYTDLIRKSDNNVKYGRTARTTSSYILQESDFAKVSCKADDGERWRGIAIGVRDSVKRHFRKAYVPYLSVLMMGFDSLSRNAFIRKLPKTYKYLTEVLKGDVLQGYNIVGDGTPQALIPILTGFTELELPETRRRMRNATYVNAYPMVWKDYEKMGYVTSFNEDLPNYGTFTYRLKGFDEQPTDHYMRTFYLEVGSYLSSYPQFCIGHYPGHQVMLNYTKNIMLKYAEKPKFVFSFHGELSHDDINIIEWADEDVENWLIDLNQSGVLNTTVLIMMSDHGNRFAEVRNTLQGKQEERLPFFSFTFPPFFKKQYRSEYKNFMDNLKTLTTPFDVHATLRDILRIQSLPPSLPLPRIRRAISLFDVVPKNRSCADAYIEPHWCTCLSWTPVNDTDTTLANNIAQSVVDKINEYTSQEREICEVLELKAIEWLSKLAPQENLLRFKQNADNDGFLADLTSNTNITSVMYQVKIVVAPGDSIFEASITHNLIRDILTVNLADISRVNKYGSQANCIYGRNPELRKYCFCKSQKRKLLNFTHQRDSFLK